MTPENFERLKTAIRTAEGKRLKPYKCPAGKWSIGYGRNLEDVGITDYEAEVMLDTSLGQAMEDLRTIPWFHLLDDVRQAVLIDMRYNLGMAGLRKFKKTLAAIAAGDYETAADQMLDSQWARQVGDRALRLSEMMRRGTWES